MVTTIEISRATMGNIEQNLVGAFAYNMLGVPIAMGFLYPFFGILLNPLIAGPRWLCPKCQAEFERPPEQYARPELGTRIKDKKQLPH